jgi:hypothetical protein
MNQVQLVDDAVTQYLQSVNSGNTPRSVRAATLAHFAGVSIGYMSTCLQVHRFAQKRGNTQYILGCEGYGRNASWRILAKPNSDPVYIQNARRQHGKYVARDALRRYMGDRLSEVKPGLQSAAADQMINSASTMVEQQLEAAVQFIESVL